MSHENLQLKATVADLKKKQQKLISDRDLAMTDAQDAIERINELETLAREANTKKLNAEHENEQLDQKVRDLLRQLEEFRRKINELEDKIEDLNHELDEDEKELSVLRKTKKDLEGTIVDLRVQLASQDEVDIAPMQVTQVEAVYADAPMDFGPDPEELRSLQDENNKLNRDIKRLERDNKVSSEYEI